MRGEDRRPAGAGSQADVVLAPGRAAGRDPMDELTVVTWRVPRADAAVLERATLPEPDRLDALRRLQEAAGAQELVYIPTCQRVAYAFLRAPDDAASRLARAYEEAGRPVPEPEVFRGADAFRHLCETASSLDSLVVGEPQVLGQVKESLRRNEEAGLAKAGMRHVFNLVLRAAKAVRTETDLFRGKVSLVPLTEDILARHLQGNPAPRALVVGTGQIGMKAAELIRQKAPAARIDAVSRSADRARDAAALLGGEGLTLDALLAQPPRPYDVIALAMASDAPFLDAERLAAHARLAPVLVLDLALPRNAARPAAPVADLTLVQLDDLTRLSEARKSERQAEVETARGVLSRELARIEAEYAERVLHRDLAALDARFREVMEARWAELPSSVDANDAAARKWYEQTVRALLHEATQAVKKAGCEGRRP